MQLRTQLQVLKLYSHAHTCSSALSSTKNIYSIEILKRAYGKRVTAELLVECKCQFIRVNQEQASKKLEKTTIHIMETSCSAELVTPDHFWSGRTTFSYQNWSSLTIFSQPRMVWPNQFFIQNRSSQPPYPNHFFCDRPSLFQAMCYVPSTTSLHIIM